MSTGGPGVREVAVAALATTMTSLKVVSVLFSLVLSIFYSSSEKRDYRSCSPRPSRKDNSPERKNQDQGGSHRGYKKDRRGGKNSGGRDGFRKGGRGSNGSGGDGASNNTSGNNNTSSRGENKQKKSESTFSSPSSFEEAWSGNFFTASLLMLITSLGFIVSKIPWLQSLPIGGRLTHCLKPWQRITSNDWVCNIIKEGYKIPFKYFPKQTKIPSNPQATGTAYKVLVDKAAGLHAKGAVVTAESCNGH